MSAHTFRTQDLAWPWAQRWGGLLQWSVPSKNLCIVAIIAVALWMIAYCTVNQVKIPDGAVPLIGTLLAVNGLHSAAQSWIGTKKPPGAPDKRAGDE